MATLKVDLIIIRGDTSSINFSLADNGEPVDLTDATVYFTAKPALTDDATDSTAVIAVEVTSHTDPTNGKTVIPLTATNTNVTPGEYFYDIQVKAADGTITSIPTRKMRVDADVTRRTT